MSEWVDIPGYEGLYQITKSGEIRSLTRARMTSQGPKVWTGKILKPFVDPSNGYLYVNLSNVKPKKKAVHELVLLAFVGPRPRGLQACHGDGIRTNPKLDNLRWDTPAGNSADRLKHGTHQRGERNSKSKLTKEQVQEIRSRKENSLALAKVYGVASSTIRAVRIGQNWGN